MDGKRISAPENPDLSGQRHFARNLLFSWGGYLVNLAAGFILPRMVDVRLGQFQLGLWDFAWSVIGYLGLMELGIGAAVPRFFARDRAVGNLDRLTRSVSSMAVCMNILGIVIMLIAAVIALFILPLFREKLGGFELEAQWIVFLLAGSTAAESFFSVYWSALVASHRWDTHNTISAIVSLLSTAGMICAIYSGGGLIAMAAIQSGTTIGGHIWRKIAAVRICPDLRIDWRTAELSIVLDQIRFAVKNLVPRVAEMLLNQTVNVLLAIFAGPASLAVFARPRALTKHLRTFVGKFSSILIPSASALQAQDDHKGLFQMFMKRSEQASSFSVPALLWLSIIGGPLISVWMGPQYFHPGLVPILTLGFLATVVQDPVWAIMTGLNKHGRIALMKLYGSIVCVAASGVGLMCGGDLLLNAALGITIPMMVVDGYLVPLIACRSLGVTLGEFYRGALLRPFLYFLPAGVCLIAIRLAFPDQPMMIITIGVLAGSPIQAVILWKYALPAGVRLKIKRLFLRSNTCETS